MGHGAGLKSVLISIVTLFLAVSLHCEPTDAGPGSDQGQDDALLSFNGGNGSASHPYQISNVDQLQNVSSNVSAHYVLIDDIDAFETAYWNGGYGFIPIGYWGNSFKGSLDGQNHTISNLVINRKNGYNVGLFGYVENKERLENAGRIENVVLKNVTVLGSEHVGGLVGEMWYGTVKNIHVYGSVSGWRTIGGLVGWHAGYLEGSSSTCHVSGESQVGGLVGRNSGKVEDCYATGNVTGGYPKGGLIGLGRTIVENSFYNINATKINGMSRVTSYGIYEKQFDDWIANNRSLEIDDYLNYNTTSGFYELFDLEDLKDLLPFALENHRFQIRRDIDLSSEPGFWIPIFLGAELDGNQMVVSDLNVTWENDGLGLIGYLGPGSTVANISLENVNVTGRDQVGGLIGLNSGSLMNSYATGNVTGNQSVGGLVGTNDGTLERCSSACVVVGVKDALYSTPIGGLVGSNRGRIEDCSAAGSVSGYRVVGGLIGHAEPPGIVMNNYATGTVSGGNYMGGLIGWSEITVENCSATGMLSGGTRLGGLIGLSQGNLINCYATGQVFGVSMVGGLVGMSYGNVSYCYAAGRVQGGSYVGGLIGTNMGYEVENSFWDNQTSWTEWSEGGVPKNTTEMKLRSTFTGATWDLNDTWDIIETTTYPFLRVQYHVPRIPAIFQPRVRMLEDNPYKEMVTLDVFSFPGSTHTGIYDLETDCRFLTITRSGLLSGTPSNADVGVWSAIVMATDLMNSTGAVELTIQVLNVNDDPEILIRLLPDARENELYSVMIEARDIDPTEDTLEWGITGTNAGFIEIDPSSGSLTGAPSTDDIGYYWVKIEVIDDMGGSTTHTFSFSVRNVNDDPILDTGDIEYATEDSPYENTYKAHDIDPTNDRLSWKCQTNADFLEMDPATGRLFGTPSNDDVGVWWVDVIVQDGHGGLAFSNFTLTVLNVNDDPTILTSWIHMALEDDPYRVRVVAFDVDPTGDTLQWAITGTDAMFLEIDSTTGELSGTPGNEHVGEWQVEVSVSDGIGGSSSVLLVLTVENVNDDPTITTEDVATATEDEEYRVRYQGTDVDPTGDDLDWWLRTNADFLSFSAEDQELVGTPTNDHVGEWWVKITILDGIGGLDWTNFTLTVLNTNDLPIIDGYEPADGMMVKKGKAIAFSVNVTDEDGDDLTITWKDGEEVLGTGSPFEWSKLSKGEHTITVVVDDGTGVVEESFTIRVTEEEESPGPGLVAALAAVVLVSLVVRRRGLRRA